MQIWKNLVDKKYGGARGIDDPDIKSYLQKLQTTINITELEYIKQEYTQTFMDWINSTTLNSVYIDNSWYPVYANGTTDAFDKFYMKFRNLRFRVLPGEYFYHKITFTRLNFNWEEITDPSDIKNGDAFIISLPFSDTGSEHHNMMSILEACKKHDVPVLLDCCYFGQCSGLNFPINHPSIHTVTFSLSKCFDIPSLRAGIRFTREDDDDPLFVYHKNNYINHYTAAIATELMTKFSSDYIYFKYSSQQLEICKKLQVAPSDCVNLATTSNKKYSYLNRGNDWNRLNVAQEFTTASQEILD